MDWLAKLSISRPVFATVMILVLVVLGGLSYTRLGLDYFPSVDFPVVVVTTTLPGGAAEEIESDVSDKVEGAVNTISGIDELRSTSSEGVSQVVITFELGKSVDVAAQEVRDKVSGIVSDLPKGIDPPVVSKVDPGASPVLYLALRSKQPIRETTELADKVVRRQIESISGVGEVQIVGGRKRQVNVSLDPIAMRSLGVTAVDVQAALAAQNLNVPGGSLKSGPQDVTLRVAGKVTSVEQLGDIVVRQSGARPIRVADIAKVEDGAVEQDSAAEFDDEPTVVLMIKKQSGKNTVAVVDGVLARLDAVRSALPAGVKLDVVYDNSSVIRTSTRAVIEHLELGAALAAIIVLLFLGNARSTLIAALAIPISIVGTFAVMYVLGFTLNFLTLLALALAVGLVIDDAIVVIENIVHVIETRFLKPKIAAGVATKEIGFAVLASTLALMAVFIPVAFMGGIVGMFLKSFALTMASAIGVSLFVSFTLTPMLGSRWLKGHDKDAKPGFLSRVVDVVYRPIERVYVGALKWALGHRWVVILACVASLASIFPVGGRLGGGFIPVNDKAQFQISMRAPEGTSVAETVLYAQRLTSDVKTLPGVTHALVTVGADDQKTANLATIRVLLSDPDAREVSQAALMDRTRKEILSKLPMSLRTSVAEVPDFSSGGTQSPVAFALTGPSLTDLSRYATDITNKLKATPGAVDVDNTLVVGKPEMRAIIDRDRAADLGVQIADVASTLQLNVGGLKASTYTEDGQEYDVRVRADERFRSDAQALNLLSVPSRTLGSIPLLSVVKMVPSTGPSAIDRIGRARQITITAASAPGVGDNAVGAALQKIAADEKLPPTYRLLPTGTAKESAKMASAFALAFGMSFVFMYLILAAQFESWLNPLIILIALPLTVPFGLISLLVFRQSITLFSMLGLLVLFGVVQKNAVLQIDQTLKLLKEGKPLREAILEASRQRLRPILMTTLAFVAGMVPLLISRGIGAGFNQAMSGIVVGGQAMSLALTLLATPVFFSFGQDAIAFVSKFLPKRAPDDTDHEPGPETIAPAHAAAE
jgi:hydrophobe/amphiphile efflux-1 (HAE1) family protein